MEITIKIEAPELVHAIETLAIAIGCTVDKIGVGQAIEEAVKQKPAKVTKEDKKVTKEPEKITETPKEVTETPKEVTEEPELAVPVEEDTETNYTIEQIREVFVSKNSKANQAKLKAVLKKYGVAKVTELKEEQFNEVMKDLEAI